MALDKQEIARLVIDGKSYQEIADRMGCSRERIRQISNRVGSHDVVLERRAERKRLKTSAALSRISPKYGLPMESVRHLIRIGATRAYTMQRRQANDRGIEWLFTFQTWWDVWDRSGRWGLRGRKFGNYVMARKMDAGPYSPDNVYICTCSENLQEMQSVRKVLRDALLSGKVGAA